MRDTNLVNALREHAEWAEENQWETPITLGDDLAEAADRIEAQAKEIEKLRGQVPHWIPVEERLPENFRKVLCWGEYFRHGDFSCHFRHEDNGNCTAVGGFCTAVTAAHCPLLRQYLDTGMTPEAFQSFVVFLQDLIGNQKASEALDRIRQLVKADRDGRLVVLPCKVGDTLWVTGRDNVPREMELEAPDIRAVCTDEDNLCMSTCNRKPDGFCAYRLRNDGADIGKAVFLTREEAEKALEAKKDE